MVCHFTRFCLHYPTVSHLLCLKMSYLGGLCSALSPVFRDLEKVYDHAWRYDMLCNLQKCGLLGNLPLFICGFLLHRRFWVTLVLLCFLFLRGRHDWSFSFLSLYFSFVSIRIFASFLLPFMQYTSSMIFCSSAKMHAVEQQLQSVSHLRALFLGFM